jgi:hypothetical protein
MTREHCVHLGSSGSAGDRSGSAGDNAGRVGNKTGRAGDNSGSAGDYSGSAGDKSGGCKSQASERQRQVWVHLESHQIILRKTSSLGTLLVRLKMIATTYCSKIVNTHVLRLYSHLCIYV